jgi:hypothetical protein
MVFRIIGYNLAANNLILHFNFTIMEENIKPKKKYNRAEGYKKPNNRPGNSNNPSGKPKGALNKVSYDVKKRLSEGVDDDFMQKLFTEIEDIESYSERVKARIKVIEFFVPKPKDEAEKEKDDLIRDRLLQALELKK